MIDTGTEKMSSGFRAFLGLEATWREEKRAKKKKGIKVEKDFNSLLMMLLGTL